MAAPGDELVEHAAAGDRQALTTLLARHGPAVWDRLAHEIPQRWQALLSRDDLLQQSYTDAVLSIRQLVARNEQAFAAWLTTLARRNLLDAIRMLEAEKRGGGRRRIESGPDGESFVALFEMLGGSSRTASREAAAHEAQAAVQRAIDVLPDAYRNVVRMYDLEGRPVDEVAAALGRSAGAVFMLRARAHRCLADTLGTASRFLSDRA